MKLQQLKWIQVASLALVVLCGCVVSGKNIPAWEKANPVVPIPDPPLGVATDPRRPKKLTEFPDPPTPERVRLGRWLFFDKRLSGITRSRVRRVTVRRTVSPNRHLCRPAST